MEISKTKLNLIDSMGMISFVVIFIIASFFFKIFNNISLSLDEVLYAFGLASLNMFIFLLLQRRLFASKNFIKWFILFKGLRIFFLIIVLAILSFLKIFENNRIFYIFLLGFFFIGFIVEILLISYKK